MRWPDIFFRARKRRPEPVPAPPFKPSTENPKLASPAPSESINRPVTVLRGPQTLNRKPVDPATFPGANPIALRSTVRAGNSPAPIPAASSDKNVSKSMEDADPIRALTQSGGVRLTKRNTEETSPASVAPASPSAQPPATSSEPARTESTSSPVTSASTSSFRRKAKMIDLARSAPPSEGSVTESPAAVEPTATVIPPSFPVTGAAGSAIPSRAFSQPSAPSVAEKVGPVSEAKADEPFSFIQQPEPEKETEPTPDKPTPREFSGPAPIPHFGEKPAPALSPVASAEEAPKTEPPPAGVPVEHLSPPINTAEKREFLLANGERIFGNVLSETPESIYIDHGTLGVLTIPRSQIAKRLIEIILINGDRIVGDVMAETPDTLYVRHASLGMLTVPRAQRSTRVVEAILKDGDRILGEVLGETENFTVIKSATLGTVAVPHNKVALLNRKIEQVELKALPAPETKG